MGSVMINELKPCPFCGAEVEMNDRLDGFVIDCKGCSIVWRQEVKRKSVEWLKEKMIETWNRRDGITDND